jgi:hypothetical protein
LGGERRHCCARAVPSMNCPRWSSIRSDRMSVVTIPAYLFKCCQICPNHLVSRPGVGRGG